MEDIHVLWSKLFSIIISTNIEQYQPAKINIFIASMWLGKNIIKNSK